MPTTNSVYLPEPCLCGATDCKACFPDAGDVADDADELETFPPPKPHTDAERMAWLAERVSYLEHRDAQGSDRQKIGGWWPHSLDDDSQHHYDCLGLGLIEYIDRMMDKEGA